MYVVNIGGTKRKALVFALKELTAKLGKEYADHPLEHQWYVDHKSKVIL